MMNDKTTIKRDEINEEIFNDDAAGGGVCGLQR